MVNKYKDVIEYPGDLNSWCDYLIIANQDYGNWKVIVTSDSFNFLLEWGKDHPMELGRECRIVQVMSPNYIEGENNA